MRFPQCLFILSICYLEFCGVHVCAGMLKGTWQGLQWKRPTVGMRELSLVLEELSLQGFIDLLQPYRSRMLQVLWFNPSANWLVLWKATPTFSSWLLYTFYKTALKNPREKMPFEEKQKSGRMHNFCLCRISESVITCFFLWWRATLSGEVN